MLLKSTMMKTVHKLWMGASVTLFLIFIVILCVALRSTSSSGSQHHDLLHNTSVKTILIWNHFFEYKHMGISASTLGNDIFLQTKCRVTNCFIWDMADGTPDLPVDEFDLVWYHGLDIPRGSLLRDRPAHRKPHQIYFFYLFEAPTTFNFDFTPLAGFFNWTGTYRRDSDIFLPYGLVTAKEGVEEGKQWMEPVYEMTGVSEEQPKKLAAWVVSNCVKIPSNRDVYVDDLRKHMDIDVYGTCGTPCGANCTDEIDRNYKFYLAFENSACVDYVSEKFYRTLQLNVVPVVYGGGDYSAMAPPMSYIDANNFTSPRHLAEYLLFLNRTPEEYSKYFWWKKYYQVGQSEHVICQMCEKLSQHPPDKVVHDLEGWWNAPEICYAPVEAGVSTWFWRIVKHPLQFVEFAFVKILSTIDYGFALFLLIGFVTLKFLCVVMLLKRCIRRRYEKKVNGWKYVRLNKVN